MTVETARVADVAYLLLDNGLFVRERCVDLLDDLFGIFEREPVSFRPADRPGVCEGRPSIIRAVVVEPVAHGALPEVRAHDAYVELFDLFGMAGRQAAGLFDNGGVISIGYGIAVVIQEGADVIVERTTRKSRQHGVLTVVAGRDQALHRCHSRDPVEIIVENDEPEHPPVSGVRNVGEAVSEVAVAALGVRMARLFLHLFSGHHELRIAELRHPFFVRVARYASITRPVS